MSLPVQTEYEARRAARQETADALAKRADRVGNVRLGVFLGGAALAYFAIFPQVFSLWWLVLPAAAFLALVVHHDRLLRARGRARRAAGFYEAGLRRLDGTWPGTGNPGQRFADSGTAEHPYAADLDLFGRGSLFELLCAARTRTGQRALADYLRGGAPSDTPEAIRARQQAVAEIAPRLDLREDLAVLGDEVGTGAGMPAHEGGVDAAALNAWASGPPVRLPGPAERVLLAALGALSVGSVAWWIMGRGIVPLLSFAVLDGIAMLRWRGALDAVMTPLEKAARDLDLLSGLLARLEREPSESPLLRELAAALTGDTASASAAVARLESLTDLRDAERNPLFAPIGYLLLWRIQVAAEIEHWRRTHGAHITDWLAAVGQWEALASLAGFAHENPDAPFPEILPDGPPSFRAAGLAHPLLRPGEAVANDVALGGAAGDAPRLLLVSGSNMSGKSTLLRSVGANAVLALAGAPVRARSLEMTRVALGASLRTQDSLQSGISRFYAEILRLKQVTDLAGGEPPLLFLLDEILSGTNSHDRRIGAEALVRGLVAKGSIGLVTTHDLALTRIAEDPALCATNVHFEDHLDDAGTLAFDYRLHPGVVTKSNALALMRAVGLDVGDAAGAATSEIEIGS